MVAAAAVWTSERQATTSRSKRVRIEVRERSAASSSSAPPRSVSRSGGSGIADGGTAGRRA